MEMEIKGRMEIKEVEVQEMEVQEMEEMEIEVMEMKIMAMEINVGQQIIRYSYHFVPKGEPWREK